jgi:hypothetical protein
MNPITLVDLQSCLEEMNKRFPRPNMPPLSVSELQDIKTTGSWPHAGNPGVYALFNEKRELLYLGKSSCNSALGYRLGAHFDKVGVARDPWFQGVRYVATIPVPTDRAFEAPAVEEFLIARLNPSLCGTGRTEKPIPMQPVAEQRIGPDHE